MDDRIDDCAKRRHHEIMIVTELLGRNDISQPVVAFAIDEAAEYILRYTNRAVLPAELWRIKIRMAVDILKFRTPAVADDDIGHLKTIEIDDAKVEGDGGSGSAKMPNFLTSYEKQLEMWRVMPRWRRPCFEPYQRRGF